MIGYHIYYQQDNKEINFVEISSQFASALFWKEHFGEIRLYCNKKFLDTISKYRLDTLYDEITVISIDDILNKSKLSKFWSYPKIYSIYEISKKEPKFCVLDTDLWITNKIQIDETKDFIGFHYESFDINNPNNPYLRPDLFIDSYNEQEWVSNPMNCAFMYINNTTLAKEWFEYCNNTIKLNKKSYIPKKHRKNSYTLFIEQRVITYLCDKLKLNYDTLINNVFRSGSDSKSTKSPWVPELNVLDEPHKYIRHIWGLKLFYDTLTITLLDTIYLDIYNTFGVLEIQFPEIYRDKLKIYTSDFIRHQISKNIKFTKKNF